MKSKKIQLITQNCGNLLTISSNNKFCKMITNKPQILVGTNKKEAPIYHNLIYKSPQNNNVFEETLQTILALLLDLKNAQNDPNISLNNNVTVKDQIINSLKNEITNAKKDLTPTQIEKLEIISNDALDEKKLEETINSLLRQAKKKLFDSNQEITEKFKEKYKTHFVTIENVLKNYNKILKITNQNEKIIKSIAHNKLLRSKFSAKSETLIHENVKKQNFLNLNTKNIRNTKQKSIQEILIRNKKTFDQINKTYEKKLIEKIHPITPLIKLTSKTSIIKLLNPTIKFLSDIVSKPKLKKFFTRPVLINKKTISKLEKEELQNLNSIVNNQVIRNVSIKNIKNITRKENIVSKDQKFLTKTKEEILTNNKKIIKNIFENQKTKEKLSNLTYHKINLLKNFEIIKNKENIQKINFLNTKNSKFKIFYKNIKKLNIQNDILKTNEKKVENISLLNKKLVTHVAIKDHTKNISTLDTVLHKKIIKNLVNKKIQNTKKHDFFENIFKTTQTQKIYKQNQTIKNLQVTERNITADTINVNKKFLNRSVDLINKIKGKDLVVSQNRQLVEKIIKLNPEGRKLTFYNTSNKKLIYKDKLTKIFKENEKKKDKNKGKIKNDEIKEEKQYTKNLSQQNISSKIQKTKAELSKKDVENIVKSYIQGINVESISHTVMEKVQKKMDWDRKRNGIF